MSGPASTPVGSQLHPRQSLSLPPSTSTSKCIASRTSALATAACLPRGVTSTHLIEKENLHPVHSTPSSRRRSALRTCATASAGVPDLNVWSVRRNLRTCSPFAEVVWKNSSHNTLVHPRRRTPTDATRECGQSARPIVAGRPRPACPHGSTHAPPPSPVFFSLSHPYPVFRPSLASHTSNFPPRSWRQLLLHDAPPPPPPTPPPPDQVRAVSTSPRNRIGGSERKTEEDEEEEKKKKKRRGSSTTRTPPSQVRRAIEKVRPRLTCSPPRRCTSRDPSPAPPPPHLSAAAGCVVLVLFPVLSFPFPFSIPFPRSLPPSLLFPPFSPLLFPSPGP